MAFFVSKDLEDRVNEDCLIEDGSIASSLKEFVLELKAENKSYLLDIVNLKFLKANTTSIVCFSNINLVEFLLTCNFSSKILFKNMSFELSNVNIIEINKEVNDIYRIDVHAMISQRGLKNV